ncbi:hypothetical protein [Cryptosporangium sp. NPDC051539]|uniref:hypothetical protein n=1 Tax=Cryptosporangium sp. NPDC051539 TaxID=3363962 RepID=UPI0037ACC78E
MTTSPRVGPPGEPPQYSPLPPEVRRPLPTTVLWRWRYESVAVIGISTCGLLADHAGRLSETALVAAIGAAFIASTPPLRRAVASRVLCIVSAHRVRTGLAHAWVHNRYGRLPAILVTRPTDYGESVTLWCPAGVGQLQVSAAAGVLRDACWGAQHVQVTTDPRRRHLVTVHVVRRAVDDMMHG